MIKYLGWLAALGRAPASGLGRQEALRPLPVLTLDEAFRLDAEATSQSRLGRRALRIGRMMMRLFCAFAKSPKEIV